jgi:hypothetical protein
MEGPKVDLGQINKLNKEIWKLRKRYGNPGRSGFGCLFYVLIAVLANFAIILSRNSPQNNKIAIVVIMIAILAIAIMFLRWRRLENREKKEIELVANFRKVCEAWAGKLGMEYKTYDSEGTKGGKGSKDKIRRHDLFFGKYKGYEARVEDYSCWREPGFLSAEEEVSVQLCRTAVTLMHSFRMSPLVIYSKHLEYEYFWTERDRPRLPQDHQYFWIEDRPRLKRFKLESSFDRVFKVKGDNQEFVLKILNPAMREYLLANWPKGVNSLEMRGTSLVLVYTDGFLYKSDIPTILNFLTGFMQRIQFR